MIALVRQSLRGVDSEILRHVLGAPALRAVCRGPGAPARLQSSRPGAGRRGRHRRRNSCHASALPERASIVATDLNQSMLDHAAALGTKRPVAVASGGRHAAAFQNGTFDALCLPIRGHVLPRKNREPWPSSTGAPAGRRPDFQRMGFGSEDNEFADTVTAALASLFPEDPPRFLARTPTANHERADIERDLAGGGFTAPPEIVTSPSAAGRRRAGSGHRVLPGDTARKNEIEARDP